MTTIDSFPQNITDNVTVLGNSFFHLYLIRGTKHSALFEVGVAPIYANIVSQLDALGVTPDYLIVSHPHADHLIALPFLSAQFPNAAVVIGTGANRFAEERESLGLFKKEDEYVASILPNMGIDVDGDQAHQTLKRLALGKAHIANNGETIDLGETQIELVEVKGHAHGNILAHIKNDGVLLASDSLGCPYVKRKTFLPIFFTGFVRYISTIEKIGSMGLSLIGLGQLHREKKMASPMS